jgi:hypothetical protein
MRAYGWARIIYFDAGRAIERICRTIIGDLAKAEYKSMNWKDETVVLTQIEASKAKSRCSHLCRAVFSPTGLIPHAE